jgi:hypothetical protein
VEQKPAAMHLQIYENQLQIALSPAQEITHPNGQKQNNKINQQYSTSRQSFRQKTVDT